MTHKSEILKIPVNEMFEAWKMPLPKIREASEWTIMYKHWAKRFHIEGIGYTLGDIPELSAVKAAAIIKDFPKVEKVIGVDMVNGNVIWDVCTPAPADIPRADFIFSAQLLEHVVDPIAAMRNTVDLLNDKGLLFVGVPRFGFKYHAFPIDCYRFSPDAIFAWCKMFKIQLLDWFLTKNNIFAIYRKI